MRRTTLAECIKAEMVEAGETKIWAGKFGLCGEAYARFGGKVQHPLNRTKAVIDAARRSPLFDQIGYIRAIDTSGRREILHPAFALRSDQAEASKKGAKK